MNNSTPSPFKLELIYDDPYEFIEALKPWRVGEYGRTWVYRGHACSSFQLLPSSLRASMRNSLFKIVGEPIGDFQFLGAESFQVTAELKLLREFYKLANRRGLKIPKCDYFSENISQLVEGHHAGAILYAKWLPDSLYELAALAQHYGVPTRLLDWTYDPFTALYFAAQELQSTSKSSSDHLSVWAMSTGHAAALKSCKIIVPQYAENHNVAAQSGLFSHWEQVITPETKCDYRPLDVLVHDALQGQGEYQIFREYKLPKTKRNELMELLRKAGLGPSKIFPGFDGCAKEVLMHHRMGIHFGQSGN